MRDAAKIAEQYLIEGKIDEAERCFIDMLKLEPGDKNVLNGMGVICHDRGHKEKAEEFFLKAVAAGNTDLTILMNLAGLYREAKRWREAAVVLETCIRLDRGDPGLCNWLADVYFKMDERHKGLRALSRSLELDNTQQTVIKTLKRLWNEKSQVKIKNTVHWLETEFVDYYNCCRGFTMVDWKRCYDLYLSTRYIHENNIPGALVECGVWKGGCCMLMAFTMLARNDGHRDIFLYDTFAGMTRPTEDDVRWDGKAADTLWEEHRSPTHNMWCYAGLDEVRENMALTQYDKSRLHFVRGPVEETVPGVLPDEIALLRLDTDFFESTYHELVHLFPHVVDGGVLILDDFNYWNGQRKAVKLYFEQQGISMKFASVSASARGIKGKECANEVDFQTQVTRSVDANHK